MGEGNPRWVGVLGENWAFYRQTHDFLCLRSEHLQPLTPFFMTASFFPTRSLPHPTPHFRNNASFLPPPYD